MEPSEHGFSDKLTDLLRRWYAGRIADFDIGQPVAEPSEHDRVPLRALRRQAIAVIEREVPSGVRVKTG